MKQHADRLKNFVLENPFQNDSKFIGLGERNNFNAQNACSSFQKFNKDQPRAGKHCDVNYTINLEPRSVKGGNDCSLTTGSGAIAPLSVVETVDPLDEDYDLLRKKKEELLQIQQNVKNSLETISSKINQTLPSDSDPKEHRRNHAFAVSNPSVKMMKSKYGKASQNLSRNTNKIHNCLKTTHSTNQSNLRGRKGKKKTTRKLENQTFEEKREKHCLKKMSEYTNHATKHEDTSPKKAINIMKSFDCDPKFRHPGYLYHNKANEYVYPQQYQSTSVDNRNSSSCSRNGNSVRRDRATRNREASLASGESNAEKSVTSKGKLYKVGSKRNNENKTPVRSSNVTISMKNRDKSRGKSSYKNSYAGKLANMKACKSLSVKIIKQLSSCNEPTHGLEKVLRNFSDLVAIFDNSRYKVCDDTFEKWLKLTSQLKLSAKTHLTDLSSEVSKRYKMKFDGTTNKKSLKNVKSSKKGDSKRSSKRSSLLQSKRISRVPTKKALNSSKEEFGISRSFSKPFLNQEIAAKYHCNILVEKDPINEHQILSSFGGTPCHEKENRIISFEEKVKSKKLEAPCVDGNIMLSPPKGSMGLNDSESMDEPNQFPPVKTEKSQNEEINFSDVQTTNFFNPPQVEEKVHDSQNDKSNIALLKIKDKENEHKGIFDAESSHELEDSPIKKASTKLSKWVENVKQEKYQSEIYSQKFESKRSIKQMKVGRYLEAEQPDKSHNRAHEYTSLGKSTENVSYSSHQSNEFSKYLESHADKVQRNREAEERMNKILYSADTNSL